MGAPATSRSLGCLFGLALGDALGAETEFLSVAEIERRFPPHGPLEPPGRVARVTDDTQMALAVGEALVEAARPWSAATLEPPLRQAFVNWWNSPENNRAPGMTCLRACEQLAQGTPWYQATVATSKGCGANMRVAPVGVLPTGPGGTSASERAAIAQFQAALTHGHPTALAAADLTAAAIADLALRSDARGLPGRLRVYAESQRTIYHAAWLGPLWQRPAGTTPEDFIARGWGECLAVLDRLDDALTTPNRAADPCEFTGEGWVAEEAFATGLLCFLLYPDDPVAAIRHAARTAGDSDSIACLAGAFAGAYRGLEAWPEEWVRRVEYHDRLMALGVAWGKLA